jgi:hypothetical protein
LSKLVVGKDTSTGKDNSSLYLDNYVDEYDSEDLLQEERTSHMITPLMVSGTLWFTYIQVQVNMNFG